MNPHPPLVVFQIPLHTLPVDISRVIWHPLSLWDMCSLRQQCKAYSQWFDDWRHSVIELRLGSPTRPRVGTATLLTCPSLKVLDLSGTCVGDEDVSLLRGCANLTELYLAHTSIMSVGSLKYCVALEILNVSYTVLETLKELGARGMLKKLLLNRTRVAHLDAIVDCNALEHIELYGTEVEIIEALQRCTRLTAVNLSCTKVCFK